MDRESFGKLVRQMRWVFGIFAFVYVIVLLMTVAYGGLYPVLQPSLESLGVVLDQALYGVIDLLAILLAIVFGGCSWLAFMGVGKRNQTGRTFAVVTSGILLFHALIVGVISIIMLSTLLVRQGEGNQTQSLVVAGVLLVVGALVPAFFGFRFLFSLRKQEARRLFAAGGWMHDAWAELRRVVWPTRRETYNFTLIVLGLSVAVGVLMWVFDMIFGSLYGLLAG